MTALARSFVAPLEPTPVVIGLAVLMRHAYAGRDLDPIAARLTERLARRATDAAALMDLSIVLQLAGERGRGLDLQAQALDLARCFRVAGGDGLRVLALLTPGDLMANTPLEFLIEGVGVELTLAYVDHAGAPPADLPDHDVAFLAIGESAASAAILEGMRPHLTAWPRPILNAAAERIAALTRDGVAERLAGIDEIVAPPTRRLPRDALLRQLAYAEALYPVVARPCGSHAGEGLEKLDDLEMVQDYLARRSCKTFFLAPFIDYRSGDGRYRKFRLVFIEGAPFLCHLAISDHWMVHYLSSGMASDAARRDEEAAAMASFDESFCVRHAAALAALSRVIGLDYFGIDCAETPDGRLLVFEVDVAMIVHDLDDPELFEYKQPVMRRTFDAFAAMLVSAAAAGSPARAG